jgi:hypothetical protein
MMEDSASESAVSSIVIGMTPFKQKHVFSKTGAQSNRLSIEPSIRFAARDGQGGQKYLRAHRLMPPELISIGITGKRMTAPGP